MPESIDTTSPTTAETRRQNGVRMFIDTAWTSS
jgi:hypothetical protein